ncbi:hypothetical protein J2X65_003181 [Ancylobacter sp. 3268]|uniref:hypothetical protein n=1 Tax=Ancylobacter sp. 3268 TaxID=2817752 RepID=UPI002858F484|nr:hypothetical protein [Ancylobacter sp. 3268]MDR6953818.1 hypothetical protein [Ancylobacter sp. 3268]
MGAFIIVFKMDGEDLNLATRHIGPFPTYDAACDVLGKLPAPVNGGHKYVQQLEQPQSEECRVRADVSFDQSMSQRMGLIHRANRTLRR